MVAVRKQHTARTPHLPRGGIVTAATLGDYICGCGAEVPDDAWETDFGELIWHEAHVAEVLLHGATPTPAAEVGRREESGQ